MSIGVVVGIGYTTVNYLKGALPQISINTAKVVGETIGEGMETDQMGNVNVLIGGYAGEAGRGGYLTDTIMLASFNPKLGAVTFLSIPRDLFVSYGNGYATRINSVYRNTYLANDNSSEIGATTLADEVTEVTGIEIPYYVMVDFDGFVEFIDELGGIEVDVPSTISDPYYPGPNDSYTTFRIDRGLQTLDGDTALKYARSRKTTSDGDRSLRQQQIIK